jgi:hypothetical protein
MHGLDILKMRVEFGLDDNGTIWFQYASNITTREVPGLKQEQQTQKRLKFCNQVHRRNL